jgi:glutathione S-transferase
MPTHAKPVLWRLKVSHYSEKVRWALAHKGVEHERRAPPPGAHIPIALLLTRGRELTFPVLELGGGERFGDSTAIIAALEERFPDQPLYPDDPAERRRALELEEWFDEELGPHIRRFAFHELTHDVGRLGKIASIQMPRPVTRVPGLPGAIARSYVKLRYRAGDDAAAEAGREKTLEALDRLERELGEDGYLVGGRFTVADLTAAALFYPLVLPPEGPRLPVGPPASLERFRAPLRERRGYRWVEEMFRRHRRRPG